MRLVSFPIVVNKKEKIIYNSIMFFNESFGFRSLIGYKYKNLKEII